MSAWGTVYLTPLTFGFGPASHAAAIARALRASAPEVTLVGVGDGVARDFMTRAESFDAVVSAAPGLLPARLEARSVVVAVGDFERALGARREGVPVVVVDALYWLWQRPPLYPNAVDRYLCLAFPGVEDRVGRASAEDRSLRVIPQIRVQRTPAAAGARDRAGLLLNLGGGGSAYGSCDRFFAALIACVADATRQAGLGDDLLVTCSTPANDLPRRAASAAGATIANLGWEAMMRELRGRAWLLTLPGQSIVCEAVAHGIGTILLPGPHYSHHRQAAVYRDHLLDASVVRWDDLDGYQSLASGLPDDEAGLAAIERGNAFAADPRGRAQLAYLVAAELRRAPRPPRFVDATSWSTFDGAHHVVREVLGLLGPATAPVREVAARSSS